MKTKIFAAYLPQFHEIKENNEFWGEGFTDWDGVMHAEPQFPGHQQPKIPLNNNYYDLRDERTIRWQAKIARDHGVDGFSIYHYWFKGGHTVLEKPAEILLQNDDINIEYFFVWDNVSWVRSWSNISGNAWAPTRDHFSGKEVLLEFDYENIDAWEKHFLYLLPFFKDNRYEKIDNKPVFAMMKAIEKDKQLAMCNYWNSRAIEEGFNGMFFITKKSNLRKGGFLDAEFTYEPHYSGWGTRASIERLLRKFLHISFPKDGAVRYMYDYRKMWKRIIKAEKRNASKRIFPGCVVCYDDTPRRGSEAGILTGTTSEIFKEFFKEFYSLACSNNKEILFLTAWNEWGEGAYLEPDEENGYAYLCALKEAVEEV